jgi:hypothetical protein
VTIINTTVIIEPILQRSFYSGCGRAVQAHGGRCLAGLFAGKYQNSPG